MGIRIGVWIDHQHAHLCEIDGDGRAAELRTIESEFEREAKGHGHVGNVPAHGVAGDYKSSERRNDRALSSYYKRIGSMLRNADEVALLGPGLAKTELQKTLEKEHGEVARRIKRVEAMDKKFTEGQLVARVKEIFGIPTRAT
ncbi:MAG: hypothetical protein VYC34_11880 [Planctomycetota bacterium]|nr:hypothetical protein [Planctomycetota bacterium]